MAAVKKNEKETKKKDEEARKTSEVELATPANVPVTRAAAEEMEG